MGNYTIISDGFCPDCHSPLISTEDGDKYCNQCDLHFHYIDTGPGYYETHVGERTKKIQNHIRLFGIYMQEKLIKKLKEGYYGWDRNDPEMQKRLKGLLIQHVTRLIERNEPQEIDIANIASFLWYYRTNFLKI